MGEMTMREYVDSIQGAGSWDKMHDLIEQQQLAGWTLPPVEVDGHLVRIFPGENREATLDQVKGEIRKFLAEIKEAPMPDILSDERIVEIEALISELDCTRGTRRALDSAITSHRAQCARIRELEAEVERLKGASNG